ncbi:MAG: hypothetical protein JWR26_2286 [Pedosphaera sp.]|nr:hypothetical protein [Pedosphaera sp.]
MVCHGLMPEEIEAGAAITPDMENLSSCTD